MTANIRLLPLEGNCSIVVPQKCLLPTTTDMAAAAAAAIKCGAWVKCKLSNEDAIAQQQEIGSVICQIYEQLSKETNTQCGYIDTSVTTGSMEAAAAANFDYQNVRIKALQPLQEVSVNAIDLIVVIKAEFLEKSVRKLYLSALAENCKILLQAFCLTANAKVANKTLDSIGIKMLEIKLKRKLENDACFWLNDETQVRISDVRLDAVAAVAAPSLEKFYNIGHYSAAALLALKDLLKSKPQSGVCAAARNALIVGPSGCGKSALVAHFAQLERCNYFRITLQHILGQYPGESEENLRRIFENAQKFVEHLKPQAPTLLHIEDLHHFCPASTNKTSGKDAAATSQRLCAQLCALLDKFKRENVAVICLATTTDSKLLHQSLHMPGRFHYEIEIVALDVRARRELFFLLFQARFPAQQLAEELLDLVADCTAGYVAADLALLVRSLEQAKLQGNTNEMAELIKEQLKKSKPTSLRGADVTVLKTEKGFETIGGMAALKKKFQLQILTGMRRVDAYKRFGLQMPKGILLYGPPGCAKTTMAKCLAAEAKMTFIATSGAEVYSPYVGCAEKFISKLFNTARRHAPCLIFLDEIDTLVGNRAVNSSSNDVQTRILSTLLTEMDGIVQANAAACILVVAATNRPQMIDDALLRPGRFDQLIHVPAPDYESRLAILEMLRQSMPFAVDCALDDLAARTENFSGADVCNLCNEAAMAALQRDLNAVEILRCDFEQILSNLKPSLTQSQIDAYKNFKSGDKS